MDHARQHGHVLIEQLSDFLGLHGQSQGGETTNVAKEDAYFTPFTAKRQAALDQPPGDRFVADQSEDRRDKRCGVAA